MYNKLSKLKKEDSARLEYGCKECGYILYKPLMGDDIDKCLFSWDIYILLSCPSCSEKTLELYNVWSEDEWSREHKYAEG
ncbi:MAG TPA: hypothetical protein PL110_17635 [Candidatus Eremiobacteraeota bacterium]|nr:MAG: hypothetical protein BWY64_02588 [bacterium ADurb.Bin363]HPZ09918.1 hypothetical protein [Candidatus Eremiobacteraeota bacterium]